MELKNRLIEQLNEARTGMRAAIKDLDAAAPIYPAWTVKHLLAHLTGWDDATAASLRAFAASTSATPRPSPSARRCPWSTSSRNGKPSGWI